MANNISIYPNFIVNIRKISKDNFNTVLPFKKSIYGNTNYSGYNMKDKANILNEPKLLTMPFLTINLTNNQFAPFQSDLGYLQDTSNVLINQNLDIYYKSKVWYDNYGLGDPNSKFYVGVNETIDEMPLTTAAYTQYIQNNKTQSAFFGKDLVLTGIGGALNTALSAAMVGSMATGIPGLSVGGAAIGGGVVSIVQNIANKVMTRTDLKSVPDKVMSGGNNLLYDYANENIKLFTYSVKPQQVYLDRAWKYMFRYGYTCNDFKIPDLKSRYYFNFIKTSEANLDAKIPKSHLMTLKNIFNKGTTIWHVREDNLDPTIGDYSRENMEVSLNV